MTSIKLFRGGFGHVSRLNVASSLVTHAHPEANIIIWLDGAPGEMTVGGVSVKPGPTVAVGVNSFQPHSHAFDEGCTPGSFLAFYIQPDWAERRRGLAPGAPLFRDPGIPLDGWMRGTTAGLFDQLANEGDDGFASYEIERLIDSLIDAADAAQSPRPASTHHGGRPDFRVRKAIELMRANVSGRIGLDEVARSVGLSRPHFFALFKEQMNLTPNVFWNTLRMEEALRQIQTSQESLTAVACNLGFTTQGNFTRFFRDHAGVPPTLYREAARTAA
jgi:AraC family transcriptional regulator